MTVKTILVALTTPEAAGRLMPPVTALARRTGAHVIGLHTIEALAVYPGIAMHVTGATMQGFQQAQSDQAAAIEEIFTAATRAEDFVSEWRLVRARSMTPVDRIVEHACGADLVVMSQEEPGSDRPDQHHIQEQVIRESGRPVLVVPSAGSFGDIGRNVLVGWSPTREAVRAAHDLVPLMQEGGEIALLTAHRAGADNDLAQDTAREMALCYDRHGFRAAVIDRATEGLSPADVLLNESFERGDDLLVAGAFGHSRAYDLIFGAATRALLERMTVPVLFSG